MLGYGKVNKLSEKQASRLIGSRTGKLWAGVELCQMLLPEFYKLIS